ncbi:MAG: hypothetical protein CVU84_13930 [Firmicutes bacterium HGW-Firmicutes-1]|jgi:hypothetical protein|nr:MAG: hypothetical protein CVU84_13930 [Firmicutes bacterium HGW-Firmicutes-1]
MHENENNNSPADRIKWENQRRVDQLVNLIEKKTRTERHLEENSQISSPENIQHAKKIQDVRQEEIQNLKNIIVNGEHSNNDQEKNIKKNYKYTEGYIKHNADTMDETTLENANIKQEHRKEQLDFLE